MGWSDYMLMAARHSRGSARHWFRYLRKDIDKCGILFSWQDVENLSKNEALSPFQRVSLKAAFREGSPTRNHIIGLNQRATGDASSKLREKHESSV